MQTRSSRLTDYCRSVFHNAMKNTTGAMTSRTGRRSDDVSDDSALESDVSSLTDGDTGFEGSDDGRRPPGPPGSTGTTTGPRRGGTRVMTSSSRDRGRDRMLMRDWLQKVADQSSVPNMHWCNDERTMIRIPWKHGSRSGWTIDDCWLYRAWAEYTGTHTFLI